MTVADVRRRFDLGHVLSKEDIRFILERAEKAGDWAEDTIELEVIATDAWEVD